MRSLASACLAALACIVIASQPADAQQRDVAGSRDYPGIGRFGGSVGLWPAVNPPVAPGWESWCGAVFIVVSERGRPPLPRSVQGARSKTGRRREPEALRGAQSND